MSIAGLRFGHVAFRVADAERSVRWYADVLGAKKIYHAERQGERPELMFLEFANGQCIELFPGGKNHLASPADPIGYIHFCLVLDNLDQALEHLATMNVKPERKFIGRAKQRIAFISDPDGNSIELMEIPPESEIYRP
ncbi:MAG TPA: VOC family protein [Candidatus Limnocylindrales bacterium]|nr:VOC family protein [Candidatus Limnocylindrales bacterium]